MAVKMKDQFPAIRRQDPMRQAEARVYDALTRLELDGHGLYEFRYRKQQVDFPLWLHWIGRFAIEVKGGRYEMTAQGEWALIGPDGERITVPSPIGEASQATIEMRGAIHKATKFKNFIAGVLLFPDMDRDERIEATALQTSCVYTVCGLEQLAGDLERVAELADFRRPPLSRISENEWSKIHELQHAGPEALDCQRQGGLPLVHPEPVEGWSLDSRRSSSSTWITCTSTRILPRRRPRMDRQEHIEFGRYLLKRIEVDRHAPVVGGHLAACWASGAFGHLLMAHTGEEDITTDSPAAMYTAVGRLDREEGGDERWRQTAFAAYEISHHFYFDGLTADELERKTREVVQGTLELLGRLEPGGQETPFQPVLGRGG